MNIKTLALLLIMISFLAGAFICVLDPSQVNWQWYIPVLAVGLVALFIYRKAHHGEARASPVSYTHLRAHETASFNAYAVF